MNWPRTFSAARASPGKITDRTGQTRLSIVSSIAFKQRQANVSSRGSFLLSLKLFPDGARSQPSIQEAVNAKA